MPNSQSQLLFRNMEISDAPEKLLDCKPDWQRPIFNPTCLPIEPAVCQPISLAIYLCIYLPMTSTYYVPSTYLSIYPSVHVSLCLTLLSIYLVSSYLCTYLPAYPTLPSIYLSTCVLSIFDQICLPIVYPSLCLLICLSIYLSHPSMYLSIRSLHLLI